MLGYFDWVKKIPSAIHTDVAGALGVATIYALKHWIINNTALHCRHPGVAT